MKTIYGVSKVRKKCFWANLRHLNIILRLLNFSRKIKIFRVFGWKRLEKRNPIAPSKRKIRCKVAFQAQKFLFSKSTAHLDVFCTICGSLTPNTYIAKTFWRKNRNSPISDLKVSFVKKTSILPPKLVTCYPFSERCRTINNGPWNTSKVWKLSAESLESKKRVFEAIWGT